MFHRACVTFSFGVALMLASGQASGGSAGRVESHAEHWNNRSGSAAALPASNDIHFNYKIDVPWDWAHRYPPGFLPPAPPVIVGVGQTVSDNTDLTFTFDVPWDWAHRYPPGFLAAPVEPPPPPMFTPVSGCRVQDVTVGTDKQTVTIVRC
jgi:hypothetical protein